MLEKDIPEDALYCAIYNGSDSEIVEMLLEAGANVHTSDDEPLRSAAENGDKEVVKVLLEAGADVHANDDDAFRWAVSRGNIEIARILLKAEDNF